MVKYDSKNLIRLYKAKNFPRTCQKTLLVFSDEIMLKVNKQWKRLNQEKINVIFEV